MAVSNGPTGFYKVMSNFWALYFRTLSNTWTILKWRRSLTWTIARCTGILPLPWSFTCWGLQSAVLFTVSILMIDDGVIICSCQANAFHNRIFQRHALLTSINTIFVVFVDEYYLDAFSLLPPSLSCVRAVFQTLCRFRSCHASRKRTQSKRAVPLSIPFR